LNLPNSAQLNGSIPLYYKNIVYSVSQRGRKMYLINLI